MVDADMSEMMGVWKLVNRVSNTVDKIGTGKAESSTSPTRLGRESMSKNLNCRQYGVELDEDIRWNVTL